jgi:hypothetical protein
LKTVRIVGLKPKKQTIVAQRCVTATIARFPLKANESQAPQSGLALAVGKKSELNKFLSLKICLSCFVYFSNI